MTPARHLGTVHIDGHAFYVTIPGCAPSSQPALPAAPDAGPETSSGAAGTS